MGDLERSLRVLVALNVFVWVFNRFSPLLLEWICSFADSKVECCRVWAAPAVFFSQGM